MIMMQSEGHRLHLKALVRQERSHAYRRHDYLSHEWQTLARSSSQWSQQQSSSEIKDHDHHIFSTPDKNKAVMAQQQQHSRHSPSSAGNMMMIPDDDDEDDDDAPATAAASSDMMCIRWREKIIEWKYQVIDRFGKLFHHTFFSIPLVHLQYLTMISFMMHPQILAGK
jgi:hypothetical protein